MVNDGGDECPEMKNQKESEGNGKSKNKKVQRFPFGIKKYTHCVKR